MESFHRKVAGISLAQTFLLKKTPSQAFSCEFIKILQESFFTKHHRLAPFDVSHAGRRLFYREPVFKKSQHLQKLKFSNVLLPKDYQQIQIEWFTLDNSFPYVPEYSIFAYLKYTRYGPPNIPFCQPHFHLFAFKKQQDKANLLVFSTLLI